MKSTFRDRSHHLRFMSSDAQTSNLGFNIPNTVQDKLPITTAATTIGLVDMVLATVTGRSLITSISLDCVGNLKLISLASLSIALLTISDHHSNCCKAVRYSCFKALQKTTVIMLSLIVSVLCFPLSFLPLPVPMTF
jgi:hypothetical protein